MNRNQWILTGILAAQALLLVITAPWSGSATAAAPHPLLPELASFTPSRLEIHESDERSIVLDHEGEGWVLDGTDGFPADSDKVDKLLDTLGEIQVRRPVVSSARYHGALKVLEDDHERRVRLWDAPGGDAKIELLVGTSPNYRLSHVRVGGEDEVYEANGISVGELGSDASAWVDRKFVSVPFDDITRLKLSNDGGSFEVARDEEGGWTLVSPAAKEGKELDQRAVDSIVRSFTSISLSQPAGLAAKSDYGLQSPTATVEISYRSDGDSGEALETLEVRLGAAAGDDTGKRYASRSGFDHAVILSNYDAEKLTAKKLADLYPTEK